MNAATDAPAFVPMGVTDLSALDGTMLRIDQTASALDLIATFLAEKFEGSATIADALQGLVTTLAEQASGLDDLLSPHRRATRGHP